MLQIRQNLFETNSSSTHTLTFCTGSEFEKWKNGELIFNTWDEELVPYTDNIKKEKEEAGSDSEFRTYDEFFCDDYLESYISTYTTHSGDEVVAFGKYGYDG